MSIDLDEGYRRIISEMPGHVFWVDINGKILGCNSQQAHSLGYSSEEEVKGLTIHEVLLQGSNKHERRKEADFLLEVNKRVAESGVAEYLEEPHVCLDGSKKAFLTKKIPLYSKENKIQAVLGISFDITEQKRAQELEKQLLEE